MTTKTFKTPVLSVIFTCSLFISFINSAPVNSSISYENFMKDIKLYNCSFPDAVMLPFKSSVTFDYLSQPLGICKASEISKHSKEAITLCREVFDTLKDITCHTDKKIKLPRIHVDFTDDVCQNISSLQSDPSLKNESLLKHLTDKFICNIMCADDFRPACRVLLWSNQVQRLLLDLSQKQKLQVTKEDKGEVANEEESVTTTKTEDLPVAEKKVELNKGSEDKIPKKHQNSVDFADINKENKTQSLINKTKGFDTDVFNNKKEPYLESHEILNENTVITADGDKEIVKTQELNKSVSTQIKEKDNEINYDSISLKLEQATDKNQNEKGEETKNKENKIMLETKIVEDLREGTTTAEKEISSTNNKISEDEEINKIHPGKELDVSGIKSNPAKVFDKTTESGQKQNELGKKDVAQPAIVPEITNEAEEGKMTKQEETTLSKGKKISESEIMPKVDNEEELPSVTTLAEADLEKMEEGNGIPESVNKDQDPYKDEDGFNEPTKNKKTDEIENSIIPKPSNNQNELPKYDVFPPRNSIGQGSEDIQVISGFPEQEDSHFFFYFLSLVLILMGGYLLFHNKQKIIALIVEGRHERRRRSHGIGYKKLETK